MPEITPKSYIRRILDEKVLDYCKIENVRSIQEFY